LEKALSQVTASSAQEKYNIQKRLDEEKTRNALLTEQHKTMIGDIDVLKEKLRQSTTSSTREKADIQKKLESEFSRNSLLSNQQQAMVADMDRLEKSLYALDMRAERVQAEFELALKAANDSKEHIARERDRSTAELKTVLEAQNRVTANLAHRNEELAAAHAEIDRILNSRSMRITHSLRSFANFVRGRR
ncbi:MAG: hypothetical protein ABJI18_09535, partial [Lentilitoribacter sp.]